MRLFGGKEGDFAIEKASDEDITYCVDIILKAMKTLGVQSVTRENLEQTLKTPNVLVLVAKVKAKVVGMISGLAFPSLVPPPRIDFLSVSDEESARKGLYGMLIDAFLEELKKRLPNVKYVDTTVPTLNPQFVAIYSMKGFLVAGLIRGEEPNLDSIILRRNLSREPPRSYTA